MTHWIILIYLLIGCGAGVMAGLLGVGGGMITVPALLAVFTYLKFPEYHLMHFAVGTTLATIIVTSIASAHSHYRYNAIMWSVLPVLIPAIVLGAFVGAYIADHLNTKILSSIFGIFAIAVALQMIFKFTPMNRSHLPSKVAQFMVGLCIACASSLVGIGGGTFTVPFLVWCRFPIKKAVGTAAACGFPIAVAGTVGFILMGWQNGASPEGSSGYVYWPAFLGIVPASMFTAPLGAKLAHHLPSQLLHNIFACFLVVIGFKMLML